MNYSALQQEPLLGKSLMETSALAVSKEVGKGSKVEVTFELILFFPSIFPDPAQASVQGYTASQVPEAFIEASTPIYHLLKPLWKLLFSLVLALIIAATSLFPACFPQFFQLDHNLLNTRNHVLYFLASTFRHRN